jgi:hypothetical protein
MQSDANNSGNDLLIYKIENELDESISLSSAIITYSEAQRKPSGRSSIHLGIILLIR